MSGDIGCGGMSPLKLDEQNLFKRTRICRLSPCGQRVCPVYRGLVVTLNDIAFCFKAPEVKPPSRYAAGPSTEGEQKSVA